MTLDSFWWCTVLQARLEMAERIIQEYDKPLIAAHPDGAFKSSGSEPELPLLSQAVAVRYGDKHCHY